MAHFGKTFIKINTKKLSYSRFFGDVYSLIYHNITKPRKFCSKSIDSFASFCARPIQRKMLNLYRRVGECFEFMLWTLLFELMFELLFLAILSFIDVQHFYWKQPALRHLNLMPFPNLVFVACTNPKFIHQKQFSTAQRFSDIDWLQRSLTCVMLENRQNALSTIRVVQTLPLNESWICFLGLTRALFLKRFTKWLASLFSYNVKIDKEEPQNFAMIFQAVVCCSSHISQPWAFFISAVSQNRILMVWYSVSFSSIN